MFYMNIFVHFFKVKCIDNTILTTKEEKYALITPEYIITKVKEIYTKFLKRGCCKLVIDKLICAASLIFYKKIEIYFIDFC